MSGAASRVPFLSSDLILCSVSVMALPAGLLERLPLALARPGGGAVAGFGGDSRLVLPLELKELDQALPDGGLLWGGVVELCVKGGSSMAIVVVLLVCHATQTETHHFKKTIP